MSPAGVPGRSGSGFVPLFRITFLRTAPLSGTGSMQEAQMAVSRVLPYS